MGESRTRSQLPPGILSVDVEDYFQVAAFSDIVKREDWNTYTSRVDSNTRQILDLFDECGVKATFFTLGWVAERYPDLIREIQARGHEPAVHSFWHRLVYELSPEEFREDTRRAKQIIEQATGTAVTGYRAPSYSITRKSLWALDVLVELGFSYDSSIFPIRHDVYGIPDAPRTPFRWSCASGELVEFPITTFRFMMGTNLPVAGGGYLRIAPYWYTRIGVRRAAAEGLPIVTYLHPWEIDQDQPKLAGRRTSMFRHYTNLDGMAGRVRRLCADVDFRPFREIMKSTATNGFREWKL